MDIEPCKTSLLVCTAIWYEQSTAGPITMSRLPSSLTSPTAHHCRVTLFQTNVIRTLPRPFPHPFTVRMHWTPTIRHPTRHPTRCPIKLQANNTFPSTSHSLVTDKVYSGWDLVDVCYKDTNISDENCSTRNTIPVIASCDFTKWTPDPPGEGADFE